MKMFLAITLLVMAFASQSFAASKICLGSTTKDETRGSILRAEISDAAVSILNIKGNFDYAGTYTSYGTSVNGKDGHVYYEFKGRKTDYQEVVMIDEALFDDGTKGLLQIRGRGEGFLNYAFVCFDPRAR